MKRIHLILSLLAVLLAGSISARFGLVPGLLLLTVTAAALGRPQARCCDVTLSVPEILADILEAFKVETPEVFGPAGFAKDFKSNTAVLGDKVTAHIDHVPATAAYDPTPGVGFYGGVQDVTTLIEDVPVTLDQLRHVPVRIAYLNGLRTKGVDLYKAAVANVGYALGKYVVDGILQSAVSGTVSNSLLISPTFASLDSFESLRSQCNGQKMFDKSRWCFLNTPLASALHADDRMKSSLFYKELQGGEGYRKWRKVAGFSWIREYTDFPAAAGNVGGLAGDPRLAVVSVRKIEDMTETAKALGIPKVMDFHSIRDEATGLELCGITWQQGGTGDVILAPAILFGFGVGNQGGAAGSKTDNAGCLILTQ